MVLLVFTKFVMNLSQDELLQKLTFQINYGLQLMKKLQNIEQTEGALKLQRKIRQEVQFLKRLQAKKAVKLEQLSCSNLRHLGALVEITLNRTGVVAVCKNLHLDEDNKLIIDIISDEGKVWTKVIARNPKSLSALSRGKASYRARSTLDQARDYLHCAKLYPYMYKPPKVIFEFVNCIEESLACKLENLGVVVHGERLPNFDKNDLECDSQSDYDEDDTPSNEDYTNDLSYTSCLNEVELNTLNLDVTTMMAMVSNMTNGHSNYVFKQPVLTQQAQWETQRPVKSILEKLFEGKQLVCCQTAWDDFEKIINILGGEMEKKRTETLKASLTILPDDLEGKDDYPRSNLKVRGHVRLRSKTVFNFGHRIKALTVSANEGFIRAAKQQGVFYAAFIHESRALTEGKEETATKILTT